MIRKVLRWKAADSPNVRLAVAQILAGRRRPEPLLIKSAERPWGEYTQEQYEGLARRWGDRANPEERVLVPNVITFGEYLRRRTWPAHEQCVVLDAAFYEGAEIKLFPEQWLDASAKLARELKSILSHERVEAMGIDSGQGSANTCWSLINRRKLVKLISMRTLDTSVIVGKTIALINEFMIPDEKVGFDAGGGGQNNADMVRRAGYTKVQIIPFGESPALDIKRGVHQIRDRKEVKEDRYTYKNRRVQMYHELSQNVNPDPLVNPEPFAVGDDTKELQELHRQLAAHPNHEDEMGRKVLPPKQPRTDDPESEKDSMLKRLGCSPDEADSLVIAHSVLHHKSTRVQTRVL